MRNPFECFFSSDGERGLILPPSYESNINVPWNPLTGRYHYTCPDYTVRSLQRCLIWRMAIDWNLQRHIEKYDRPQNLAYATFEENCRLFGCYMLIKQDIPILEGHLSKTFFEPAESIGISKNLLELFILSMRQAEQYPLKRVTCRRNAMMLVRLVLDSNILIDLMAPGTVFARKLKAKCAELHRENFPWLLDPARISIGESVKARATDIYNEDTPSGRWNEAELLMRECMRPCAALMDPKLTPSTMCEVNMSYLEPDANAGRQPGFAIRPRREHRNLLPAVVVCGPVEWQNTDLSVDTTQPKAGPVQQK